MNIIIYGLGRQFEKNIEKVKEVLADDNIIAYADRNAEELIKKYSDIKVFNIEELLRANYDLLVVMVEKHEEVRDSLAEKGIPLTKIISFKELFLRSYQGQIQYINVVSNRNTQEKVLMLTTFLGYNGGSLAILYAALALKKRGYDVCIGTDYAADENFINEIITNEIDVACFKSFPYLGGDDFLFIEKYDYVICNVFQTINCAYECSKIKPVLWWIHENGDDYDYVYPLYRKKFYNLDNVDWMSEIKVVAVSEIAKEAFEKHYPSQIDYILPFGIPDDNFANNYTKDKIIFAVIGVVCERKAQDVFISAIELLGCNKTNCEFWIIGAETVSDYTEKIKRSVEGEKNIKILGEMDRQKMKELYAAIDVVVCCSKMETMSMTIVEGFMHGKVCITTDKTGIAQYVNPGRNGFICKTNNPIDLSEKMNYIISHYDDMDEIKEEARRTYENYFTLEKLGNNIEKLLNAFR